MAERFKVYVDPILEPIMPRYLELRHQEQAQLTAAIAAQDSGTVSTLGHRLKGSGASYGFKDLTEMGAELEQAGKDGDFARASQLAARVQEYLDNMELVYEGEL
ncbi:Hpt domain-containing protein [Salidesulfovibrio onnuriiensis]|uniref:Hpt domain-containing protein n=1 Tax=Salidesulfovibrio onnuriiensis TaxID=2583823 RepID=UPI0011CB24AA|nr:Hpt domain-containing protein [Salidesulfovibrio onnuriiensis]